MAVRDNYNNYMREYMLRRYHRIREAMLLQLGNQCAKCGSSDNLEIDHIDAQAKTMEVNRMAYVSEARRQAELKNCQALCRACHEVKTINDVGQRRAKGNHGTVSTYRYCHCDECKAAKRQYYKEYKARKTGSWRKDSVRIF